MSTQPSPLSPQSVSATAVQHSRRSTVLSALLDVPNGYFTLTLPCLGIFLSISRNIARARLEERAWEQRLAAASQELLRDDETELDLRRRTAETEWSAYGGQTTTLASVASPPYDPYYDEPYREEDLPDDREYRVDRMYGDRMYEDGEIFYKDSESGMYYRQGCKPRSVRFFR